MVKWLRGSQGFAPFSKVLVILCDQWRARQHWPAEPAVRLPSYARLKRSGLEMQSAIIASAACTPSRAAILSGKYGAETGVRSTSGIHTTLGGQELWLGPPPEEPRCQLPRPPAVPNLGSCFREAGFEVVYKGKWHLSKAEGEWPEGAPEGIEAFGFEGWRPPEGHGREHLQWGLGVDSSIAQDTAEALFRFAREGTDRWLLVSSFINPHDIGLYFQLPWDIPDLGIPEPPNFEDPLTDKPPCQRRYRELWAGGTLMARKVFELVERRRRRTQKQLWYDYFQLYGHLTQLADFYVGIVLDALESSGQRDDTLVVFLSDHGELGGSHGMMQKWYQAYEETIRIPLVFSNPKLFPRARESAALASQVDLMPTLLRMAGIDPHGGKLAPRGVDLSPILLGEARSVQDAVLFATDDNIVSFTDRFEVIPQPLALRTIRKQKWKLTRYLDPSGQAPNEHEMYDLEHDPLERTNLVAQIREDPELAKIFLSLRRELDELLREKYEHEPLHPPDPG